MSIFNSLEFDDVNSLDESVYITGESVYNAPERDVENIEIAGRNGDVLIDNGRWKNIDVTYHCGTFGTDQSEFARKIRSFRNKLASRYGYRRITDTYNPDEYRVGTFKTAFEADPVSYQRAGEFDVVFNCKPQRYLTSGEIPVTLGEWGETQTASGDFAKIENPNGNAALKSLVVDIEPTQDFNGYDKPWVGGAGKNLLNITATTQTVSGVTFTVNSDGTIKVNGTATARIALALATNASETPILNKSVIMNGCPNGGSTNTYFIQWYGYDGASAVANDIGNGTSAFIPTSTAGVIAIVIQSGVAVNNLVFYPMLRLATETDATWVPYENICPISGQTEVPVVVSGKNMLPFPYADGDKTSNGITYTVGSDGSITANGRATSLSSFDLISGATFSTAIRADRDLKVVGLGTELYTTFYYSDYRPNGLASNTRAKRPTIEKGHRLGNLKIELTAGSTHNNITHKPMVMLGADTDETYEPYIGYERYTQELGQTVYGGTLDVVSGVLTVTHGFITFNGDEEWSLSGSGTSCNYRALASVIKHPQNNEIADILCNRFDAKTDDQVSASTIGISVYSSGYIRVCVDGHATTVSAFKTWLSSNNLQVVYELATPQTYQLTTQQISLLTGTNYVFSNENITAEWGENPDVLYNPTSYDASPLLAVKGYGTISFNGYEIDLENAALGKVDLVSERNTSGTTQKSFANSSYNTGDTITLNASSVSANFESDSLINALTASDSNASFATTTQRYPHKAVVDTAISAITFTAGTSKTVTNTTTLNLTVAGSSSTARIVTTITYTPNVATGYDRITYRVSATFDKTLLSGTYQGSFGVLWVDSTISLLGDPTYIDCDLGDAYMIRDGEYISLNRYIDLGSDLPVLASGNNEITIDNTITELKITPRYWIL